MSDAEAADLRVIGEGEVMKKPKPYNYLDKVSKTPSFETDFMIEVKRQ